MLADIVTFARFPDFYSNVSISQDSIKEIEKEYIEKDWMTIDLVEELFHFTSPENIDTDIQGDFD